MTSGAFEGDLVRPLGLITLHSAYAEGELDVLLDALHEVDPAKRRRRTIPVGEKVARALRLLRKLDTDSLSALVGALEEGRGLFARRNELIHGRLFAGGRLQAVGGERRVTVKELGELAESLFSWKERLAGHRQRLLEPVLALRRT